MNATDLAPLEERWFEEIMSAAARGYAEAAARGDEEIAEKWLRVGLKHLDDRQGPTGERFSRRRSP